MAYNPPAPNRTLKNPSYEPVELPPAPNRTLKNPSYEPVQLRASPQRRPPPVPPTTAAAATVLPAFATIPPALRYIDPAEEHAIDGVGVRFNSEPGLGLGAGAGAGQVMSWKAGGPPASLCGIGIQQASSTSALTAAHPLQPLCHVGRGARRHVQRDVQPDGQHRRRPGHTGRVPPVCAYVRHPGR